MQEVRDHFSGLVPEEKWSAFWSAARKHKQVLVSGSAKSAAVVWSESADAAEDSVRQAFEKADPGRRRSSWRGSMRSAPRRWRL